MSSVYGLDPRGDLRAAVSSLLRASARRELADLVDGSAVEICPSTETWQIGERTVLAQRLGLVLAPEDFVRLQGAPEELDAVKQAFAAVVRSFETELTDLHLFVRLGSAGAGWGHAYRSAPTSTREEPTPDAVQRAAIELSRAYGRLDAAAVLERATLEVGSLGAAEGDLRRWVVRFQAADFVEVERQSKLASQVEAVVRCAAAGPSTRIGEVVFSVKA